ncbi:hypothetical protein [Microbacterium foliorum]|uniref:hypothetical protein n=1 Tax=Microbacterium foliorum TaxID=104336 RepID=UPI0012946EC2|nr:hypothetical protein [Microbacterium foliorum]
MVIHSDALAGFMALTALRYAKDRAFRLRLLAEADETPRETAFKIRRESMIAAQRRTA